MKRQWNVVALSFVFGLAAWLVDSILDYYVFYPGLPFGDLLITDIPAHELYIRAVILAIFVGFGMIAHRIIKNIHRAKETLEKSEESVRLILQNMPVMMNAFDEAGNIVVWNSECEQVLGYTSDEICNNPDAMELLCPDEADREIALREWARCHDDYRGCESKMTSKDGSVRTISWSNISRSFPVSGWTAWSVGVDTTDRAHAEMVLRESEATLRIVSTKLLSIQEDERSRLAQELHDSIGQALVAIKYRLEHILSSMDAKHGEEAIRGSLNTMISMVQDRIEETRRITTGLRPFILDDFGVVAAIDWLCDEFQVTCPNIRVERDVQIKEDQVFDPLKITMFRIVQEALNNSAKHSKASVVSVSLRKAADTVRLTIKDNGLGFDPVELGAESSGKRGFGLICMKERTELSGGQFDVQCAQGAGTTICASWPCEQ